MTTIVMNTLNGAVSEYDWGFQSMTPTQAGSASGLCALGGDADIAEPITGEIRSGFHRGDKLLTIGNAYVSTNGEDDGVFLVQGHNETWEYPLQVHEGGVSKAKPGKGIRETRLSFGYRNQDGADFHVDRIAIDVIESKNRRI